VCVSSCVIHVCDMTHPTVSRCASLAHVRPLKYVCVFVCGCVGVGVCVGVSVF